MRFATEDEAKTFFNERIVDYYKMFDGELKDAVVYALETGGKRVRPVLMLLCAEELNVDVERALPYAVALEFIHTYSLIHDDLPEMDDDLFRRGKPTVHSKFGTTKALLAGDMLLSMAGYILSALNHDASRLIMQSAIDMVNGQVDEFALTKESLTERRIVDIYSLKTGALFRASVCTPAILAKSEGKIDDEALNDVYLLAKNVGLLFQLVDDVLDAKSGHDDSEKYTYFNVFGEKATMKKIAELDYEIKKLFEKNDKKTSVFAEYLSKLTYRLN